MSHADEYADACSESMPRARKDHRCSACGETIRAGSLYTRIGVVFDGTAETVKQCGRCRAIFLAICDQDRCSPIDLGLNCGESWESVFGPCPPDVAALAFMLPHEHGASR